MGIIFKKNTNWERSRFINMQLFNAVLLFGCVVTTVYGQFEPKFMALGDMEMDVVSVARIVGDNILNGCNTVNNPEKPDKPDIPDKPDKPEKPDGTSPYWLRDALKNCCSKSSLALYQRSLIDAMAGLKARG